MKYVVELEPIEHGKYVRIKGTNVIMHEGDWAKLEEYKPKEAHMLKYLDAAYKNGFEDGKAKALEVIKERAELPQDAMGDYSYQWGSADEWYRQNFKGE